MKLNTDEILKGISESENLDNLNLLYYPDVDIEDYFFISYSHKDYKDVYADLVKLQNLGLKIWYDRYIPANSNWKEVVNRFMRPLLCKGVIFYISENSLKDKKTTEATIRELEYARSIGKPIIAINLTTSFEKDGQKNTQVLSAEKLIDKLIESGRNDLKQSKKEIVKIFPNDVLYLPITLDPAFRKEKIETSLKQQPKLQMDDSFINGVTDTTIIGIDEAEFHKMLVDIGYDFTVSRSVSYQIRQCAFSNCQSLEYVEFSSAYTAVEIMYIYDFAFSNCTSLKRIKVGFANAIELGSGAFYNCRKLANFPYTVKIGDTFTFFNCASLKTIKVSDDSAFADYTFYGCKSLKKVEESGCSISSMYKRSTNINKIGNYAFAYCKSLEDVPIPYRIEEIGEGAFEGCTSLKNVVLGPNIKKVGSCAFFNCESLEKVQILSPKIDILFSNTFGNCDKLEEIEITEKNKQFKVVKNAVYSKDALEFYPDNAKNENIIIDKSCNEVWNFVFTNNKNIKTVEINSKIQNFESKIIGCTNINKIIVDKENPYLSASKGILFNKDKTKLVYVPAKSVGEVFEMPKSVKSIACNALVDTIYTKKIVFSDKIEEVNLNFCHQMEDVVLPKNLKSTPVINGINLKKIIINHNRNYINYGGDSFVCEIGEYGLSLCAVATGLKTLRIPEGISHIDEDCFQYSRATSIHFPKTLNHLKINNTDYGLQKLQLVSLHSSTDFSLGQLLWYFPTIKTIIYHGTEEEFRNNFENEGFELSNVRLDHIVRIECDDAILTFDSNKK